MLDKFFFGYIDHSFQDVPTSFIVGMLVVFCVGTSLLLTFLGFKKGAKWLTRLMLLEYLVLLIILSVGARTVQAERAFDFTPFWSYRAILAGKTVLLTQAIMNVVAFIPIGLLLGCSFDRMKWWKVVVIGGAFSLLIETLQFVLKRGFAEVDDVWHNVVGCMIGYMLYVGIVYLVDQMKRSATLPLTD